MKTKKIKVDYHFHPNLPRNEKAAEKKVGAIYKKFKESDIRAAIITEHIYKNYRRAWDLMKKHKPADFIIFPGIEYVTRENIDIVFFSDDESIYNDELKPFDLSYEEIVGYIKRNSKLFGFVTHPFTLGRTSIIDKKGAEFTKKMSNKLGAVEVSYTVFSGLKNRLNKPLLRTIFSGILGRIAKNENLPFEFYPDKINFLAIGSDAHHIREIGPCAEVDVTNGDVFLSIINNKKNVPGKNIQAPSFFGEMTTLATVFNEWLLKKIYKICLT